MRSCLATIVLAVCNISTATPPTPVADPSGTPKNRYISISVASHGGEPTALRVTLSSLHHPDPPYGVGTAADFSTFEGEFRWVGPPIFATENDNNPTPVVAAPLQCTPYYHDWSTLGLFHVYGDAVVPSSLYDIEAYDQSCQGSEGLCADVSSALQMATSRFGDVIPQFNPPSATTQPDIADPGSIRSKILRNIGVTKASLQLLPDVVNPLRTVNVLDLTGANDAFNGRPYPGTGPTACGLPHEEEHNEATAGGGTTLPAAWRQGATTKIFLTPVPSQGTGSYPPGTQVTGQELIAPAGGFRAFLNVQIQNWNPGNAGPDLRAYQAQIDAESLLGVHANPPEPGVDLTLIQEPCQKGPAGHAHCQAALGEQGTLCVTTTDHCNAYFVNTLRTDWVLFVTDSRNGFSPRLVPAGPIVGGFEYGTQNVPVDDGTRGYLGTIVLDVPEEAAGHVYTLKVRSGEETLVVVGTQPPAELPISETFPAVIKIGIQSDATGVNRCRFISFVPGHSGEQMAIRVKLVSLHHVDPPYTGGPSIPFTSFEGEYRWVGLPTQFVEATGNAVPFFASSLQCAPHYQDWSSAGYLHVTGSAIVPSSNYEVQFVPASCMGNEETCAEISTPLALATTRWGDVETPYNPPASSAQPDVGDLAALVSKFRSAPGAPIKARALLAGIDAHGNVDLVTDLSFSHIAACVEAFLGRSYPYAGPEACP